MPTRSEAAQAAEDARAIKAVIGRNGWHKGDLYEYDPDSDPRDCPVCLMGGLRLAIYGNFDDPASPNVDYDALYRRAYTVRRYIEKANGISSPAYWNDAPERTIEDVYAALDKAAAMAEEDAAC
jgi:hypothetical protein